MRVELIYAPGCGSYEKILKKLEMVIAEEQLPLPVELVQENKLQHEPILRIDGEAIGLPQILTCADTMRKALAEKWKEMAVTPLLAGY